MELGNKLTVVTTYSHDERSAIVLHRQSDNTYIVGKNYERNGDEVSWCWVLMISQQRTKPGR